jgi:hypothetical protein
MVRHLQTLLLYGTLPGVNFSVKMPIAIGIASVFEVATLRIYADYHGFMSGAELTCSRAEVARLHVAADACRLLSAPTSQALLLPLFLRFFFWGQPTGFAGDFPSLSWHQKRCEPVC